MSGDANSTGTRLNGVDGVPAGPLAQGGGSVFGSTPAEKKAAANTIETELEPNTKKAADGAKENTSAAARTLDGWETASGLKKVTETWDQQVKMLMGRVSAERPPCVAPRACSYRMTYGRVTNSARWARNPSSKDCRGDRARVDIPGSHDDRSRRPDDSCRTVAIHGR